MITTTALGTFPVVVMVKERFARFLRSAITDWERSHGRELKADDWRKIGISSDRVTNWRMGENLPNADKLATLARFFEWDGNELMHILGVPRPKGDKALGGLLESRPRIAALVTIVRSLPDSRVDDLIRIAGSLADREVI